MITPFIVFLSCSEKTMIERLKSRASHSARSDDNFETMKKRFTTFEKQTLPVVQNIREQGKVIEANAEKNVQ